MRKKFRYLPLLFLVMLAPLLAADMGPKPSAIFEIDYAIEPVPDLTDYALFDVITSYSIHYTKLYECSCCPLRKPVCM